MQQAEPGFRCTFKPLDWPCFGMKLGKIQLAPKHLKRSLQSHLFFAEDAFKEDSGLFAARWQMDDLQQDTRIFQSGI